MFDYLHQLWLEFFSTIGMFENRTAYRIPCIIALMGQNVLKNIIKISVFEMKVVTMVEVLGVLKDSPKKLWEKT